MWQRGSGVHNENKTIHLKDVLMTLCKYPGFSICSLGWGRPIQNQGNLRIGGVKL